MLLLLESQISGRIEETSRLAKEERGAPIVRLPMTHTLEADTFASHFPRAVMPVRSTDRCNFRGG